MTALRTFDPLRHGFPYQNGKFKTSVGPIGCSVLCGGLSYAALDHFNLGIKVPESPRIPVEGNPMERYLYRRQATAHFYTWHRFVKAWSFGKIPIDGIDSQDSFDELSQYLAGEPVILCLYGNPGSGHHVVASSCNRARQSINLYDSNFPGRISTLTKENGGWRHRPSNSMWSGWFMDWGQWNDGDKRPPISWRYCRRCHSLHTRSFWTSGACVGGVPHTDNEDLEYFLPDFEGLGQGGWQVCINCHGLYRPVDAPGVMPWCPLGGPHLPSSHGELRVMTSGPGETGWRRCMNCLSLFWINGADRGLCPAGGTHQEPVEAQHYVVDCRTVPV